MNKIILVIVITIMSMSAAYSAPASMAVTLDTGYLISGLLSGGSGIGATFEYDFLDNVGICGKIGIMGVSMPFIDVSVIIPGFDVRYYLLKPKTGLYAYAGFQYGMISGTYMSTAFSGGGTVIDFGAAIKWVVGGDSGFIFEPYFGYGVALGKYISTGGYFVILKSVGGLEYGIRFGYAF